ncbi:MAG: preprotein translocase subunit SecE [Amoebophilaceae bacterium]|nr:preprotein translocase subunit SecE [Amoebophilaceae bacterium]
MSKTKLYIYNLLQEVRYKITWPTYDKLQSSSILVFVVSFMLALFIGLTDWSLEKAFVWFFNAL